MTLVPEYMQKFVCLKEACPGPCCGGWTVGFTREETARLRQALGDDPAAMAIRRTRGAERAKVHSSVAKDANGVCSLWQGRCLLADQADYLPAACRNRPRVYVRLGEQLQAGISARCAGAARDFLFRREPMEFLQAEGEPEPEELYMGQEGERAQMTLRLRFFTIDVLQARHISLERRLYLLGTFYEELKDEQDLFALESMIMQLRARLQADTGAGWQAKPSRRHEMLMWIIGGLCSSGSGDYAELFVPMAEALGLAGNDGDRRRVLYSAERRCVADYLDEHEHVLENLLVNEVFIRGLPGGRHGRWDAYMFIALMYVMVRLHLVGLHAAQGSLSREDVLRVIRLVLDRGFQGEGKILETGNFFRSGGHATMESFSVLLCE